MNDAHVYEMQVQMWKPNTGGVTAVTLRPLEMLAEYSGATTEFPAYNMTQMIRDSTPTAPSQSRRRPDVPESTAQQDEIIRGIAATEEEQLAQ